jgi:hypothetical protein
VICGGHHPLCLIMILGITSCLLTIFPDLTGFSFVLIRVMLLCCLRISNLWFKIFSPQQSKLFKLMEALNFYLLFEQNLKIRFQIFCPYTPQQNGLVERRHRHIVELGLATMFHASIPVQY